MTASYRRSARSLSLLITGLLLGTAAISAQTASDEARQGPYTRLAILNAMVIPGHGGPAYGPADIIIEQGTIRQIISYNGITGRPATAGTHGADRVIDATGMTVMPGLIDLHTHIREEGLPLQYIYNLKLAHGVTTMVNGADRGWQAALEQQRLSDENRITAPRMFPIADWGPARSRDPGHAPPASEIAPWHEPDRVDELVQQVVGPGRAHVVRVGSLAWNPELFSAVCRAVDAAGGITTVHLPPSDLAAVNAVRAAELGVTMIEHHYGYAEASLGEGALPAFPDDYNYNDESHRFRQAGVVWQQADDSALLGEVVDRLVASGVALVPTMSTYEVNRDFNRAVGLPWHELYTHRQLIEWYGPDARFHAAHHWDWTSKDEQAWSDTFRKWSDLIRAFNDRGGRLAYGVDDPYLWNTTGLGNVRELELMQQAGLEPLEVIRAATYTAARTLKRPDLGFVQTGYTADLIVVDGNPLENLRTLYAFGALTLDADGTPVRRGGVRWTIKDGVVFDNAVLIDEVLRMVAESKQGWTAPQDGWYAPLQRRRP
ncbi:MAG: amidohydrolase family protein [Gemmatimonadota bacterium]